MSKEDLSPEAQAKLDEVERRIKEAVADATAKGHPVQPGDWGVAWSIPAFGGSTVYEVDSESCLCPMGCLLLGKPTGSGFWDPESDAAIALGIGHRQVSNFVVGFDHAEGTVPDYEEDEYYFLGRKLRAELVG